MHGNFKCILLSQFLGLIQNHLSLLHFSFFFVANAIESSGIDVPGTISIFTAPSYANQWAKPMASSCAGQISLWTVSAKTIYLR